MVSRRILYVIDGLKVGGAETLLLDLLDAAAARGDAAHVAYFSPGPLEAAVAARGVPMTRLSRSGLRDPMALRRAVGLIRRWRPDVVHTHLTKSEVVGQIAARLTGTPRILSLHNTNPWRRNPVLARLWRTAVGGADACIAVSQTVADWAAANGNYPRGAIEVIDNGVDLGRFDPARTAPLDLSPHGVREGAVTVAIVGRLAPQKDHALFLQAASRLPSEPDLQCLVVGDGPLGPQIRAEAERLGLLDGRVALTGTISDMPGLLASIDVLVLSSRWEGLPMVLLEAMAMGRAVVATEVGGIPGVVRHGENGWLVPPGDASALAEAIARLARDPALRERMGRAARRTIEARFDGAEMARRLDRIYEEVGAHRRTARGGAMATKEA